MVAKIRVLIVDDHHLVRQGLAALLRASAEIEVVGEASDGRDAIAKHASLAPDVTLMDLQMPVLDGAEATRQIPLAASESRIHPPALWC